MAHPHTHDHGAHDHAHDHAHGHAGHHHHHTPASFNRAFAVGIGLNILFVVAETVAGFTAHSLALLSDAGHNLSDVMGLVLAWGAYRLARAPGTSRRTYGLRRSTILAALANATMLLLVTGAVTVEAVRRLFDPAPIQSGAMIVVAAFGVLVNGAAAWMFAGGRKGDVNLRGAFSHQAADALVALGVVVAGLIIRSTGWLWIDPAVSIGIGIVITAGTWGLLRESLDLAMDAVPAHIDMPAVESVLMAIPGVCAVHDLHVWGMSTTETALTAHLVAPDVTPTDAGLADARLELRKQFRIAHATLQIERGDPLHPCPQLDDVPCAAPA